MSSILRCCQDHPLRLPSWRWERARLINEYGTSLPGRTKDDRFTIMAAEFRLAKDKCKDELALYRLYEQYPALSMAYELWDESSIKKGMTLNPTRHELEARLLTGESLNEISARIGISAEVLEWYERLFYNVLDRLTNRTYILNQVIGDAYHKGMTDKDYAVVWKLYAYVRGADTLDYLIETFSDWHKPERKDVEDTLMADHKSTLKRKAAMASRMYNLNSFTHGAMIELQSKVREVEHHIERSLIEALEPDEVEAEAAETANKKIETNIQVMLNNFPLLVGQNALEHVKKTAISKQYEMAADLRATEMIALAAGQLVDVDKLSEYKFPEQINPITDDHGTKAFQN